MFSSYGVSADRNEIKMEWKEGIKRKKNLETKIENNETIFENMYLLLHIFVSFHYIWADFIFIWKKMMTMKKKEKQLKRKKEKLIFCFCACGVASVHLFALQKFNTVKNGWFWNAPLKMKTKKSNSFLSFFFYFKIRYRT